MPPELLTTAGALAAAAWDADGTLLFTSPTTDQADAGAEATPVGPARAATRHPLPSARLLRVARGRGDASPLGTAQALLAAPGLAANGTILVLDRDASGALLLRTLDRAGRVVVEQSLGVQTTGPVSVRWDLAHGQVLLLEPAAAGGIDLRVLRFQEPPLPEVAP
jgi:hypothetical protein